MPLRDSLGSLIVPSIELNARHRSLLGMDVVHQGRRLSGGDLENTHIRADPGIHPPIFAIRSLVVSQTGHRREPALRRKRFGPTDDKISAHLEIAPVHADRRLTSRLKETEILAHLHGSAKWRQFDS